MSNATFSDHKLVQKLQPYLANNDLCLNIGSGQRKFEFPWVNVDSNSKWTPDVVCDGATVDFPDGCAEMIVLHHVLEHFGCGEAKPLIENCYRMLKPGGSLLVFVPDLWALARMWFNGEISTQVYMTNIYGAYMDDEADRHKFGFDGVALRDFLKSCAPWNEVKRFDDRSIDGADIAEAKWIIGYEAIK